MHRIIRQYLQWPKFLLLLHLWDTSFISAPSRSSVFSSLHSWRSWWSRRQRVRRYYNSWCRQWGLFEHVPGLACSLIKLSLIKARLTVLGLFSWSVWLSEFPSYWALVESKFAVLTVYPNCHFHWKTGNCFWDGHDRTTWHKAHYTHKLTLTHETLEWQTHPWQFQQQDLMFCNTLL